MWQNMKMSVGAKTVGEFTSNPMWRPGEPSLLSPYRRRTGYSNLGRNDQIIAHNILNKPKWGLPETYSLTEVQQQGAFGLGQASPQGILDKILGPSPSPLKSVAFGFIVALLICSRR